MIAHQDIAVDNGALGTSGLLCNLNTWKKYVILLNHIYKF